MNLSTSVSALKAFSDDMSVRADNVANVNTDGFKKGRTLMREAAPSGVEASHEKVKTQGPVAYKENPQGERDMVELSNTELAEEMPGMIETQRSFEANAEVVKTQNDMLGNLLDIKA